MSTPDSARQKGENNARVMINVVNRIAGPFLGVRMKDRNEPQMGLA